MAVPLFVLALIWDRLQLGRRRWLRGRIIIIGPFTTHTTSLISGLLFVGIGVLFLTTDGTANIGGFSGVDAQYNLQSWLQNVAGTFSDAPVLLIAAVTILLILLLRMLLIAQRSKRGPPPAAAPPTGRDHLDRSGPART